jgi:hypothetical protein
VVKNGPRVFLLAAAAFGVAVAAAPSCSIYDTSLLESVGGGAATTMVGPGSGAGTPGSTTSTSTNAPGSTTTTTSSLTTSTTGTDSTSSTGGAGQGGASTTGTGMGGGCSVAGDCGVDTDCQSHTCVTGQCGVDDTAMGTHIQTQVAGDCLVAVCDGNGSVIQQADPSDLPDDGNDCTSDACNQGMPAFSPVAEHTACNTAGGHFCDGMSHCVECTQAGDCSSGVCGPTNTCVASSCGDHIQNGNETDTDCGGNMCPKCTTGDTCMVNGDCTGNLCSNGHCAPTCSDTVQNGAETDVDCGGGTCPACVLGDTCGGDSDCQQQSCKSGTCVCHGPHVVISEIRSRGAGGAADEFIELYNPTDAAVALDSTWSIASRSDTGASYTPRWTGATGKSIASHGHFLIVGSAYPASMPRDGTMTSVTDETSLTLTHGATLIDAVCYASSATFVGHFTDQTCEGTIIPFNPHNDTTSTNTDKSIERLPGGALGDCIDTNDNASDFHAISPSTPQDTTSPPT